MRTRAVALLSLFYAGAVILWVIGLAQGWTDVSRGGWIYALVVALYASLSLIAVSQRPDDARVRVFVLAQAVNTLTIVWPGLDLAQSNALLLWVTVVGGAFVYALPMAVYVHLASVIPDRHPFVERRPWFVPAHYAVAFLVGVVVSVMYGAVVLAEAGGGTLLPASFTVESALRVDGLLNVGGYLYGGAVALLLLGTAARRAETMQGRRQALIVFAGIAPWAAYIAWSFVAEATGAATGEADWELALESGLILVEAMALFVAVIGYQLFGVGVVVRKGLIYALATASSVGALSLVLLGVREATQSWLGLEPAGWQLGLALMAMGLAFHPVLRWTTRVVDAVFFPEKVRLRGLQGSLIPALARRTDLDAVALHLTRRLRRSLRMRSAALLLPDDAREFYRVRTMSGVFRFPGQARSSVLTGAELRECWAGARHDVMSRGRNGWSQSAACRGIAGMLELLGADYVVPFRLGDDLVAVLTLGGGRMAAPLDREDLTHLELLAQQASAMLENARLFHLARHDALTGLPRRRLFEERLALELSRSARAFEPIAVAMIDIDDFKAVNDSFGHPIGDRALRVVADVMRNVSRSTDVVARYGGEEFVMLLPSTDEEGARVVATKLRESLAAHPIVLGPNIEVVLTLSIGISVVAPEDLGHDVQEFVRRADHALYDAKLAGKNRFRVFSARPDERGRTTRSRELEIGG